VHIEESQESQSAHTEPKPHRVFACSALDELEKRQLTPCSVHRCLAEKLLATRPSPKLAEPWRVLCCMLHFFWNTYELHKESVVFLNSSRVSMQKPWWGLGSSVWLIEILRPPLCALVNGDGFQMPLMSLSANTQFSQLSLLWLSVCMMLGISSFEISPVHQSIFWIVFMSHVCLDM